MLGKGRQDPEHGIQSVFPTSQRTRWFVGIFARQRRHFAGIDIRGIAYDQVVYLAVQGGEPVRLDQTDTIFEFVLPAIDLCNR